MASIIGTKEETCEPEIREEPTNEEVKVEDTTNELVTEDNVATKMEVAEIEESVTEDTASSDVKMEDDSNSGVSTSYLTLSFIFCDVNIKIMNRIFNVHNMF